jgi:hypothetical protein
MRKRSILISVTVLYLLLMMNNCYANFVQSLKGLGLESYYISPGIGMTSKEEPVVEASAGWNNFTVMSTGVYSSWTDMKESDKGWRMNSGLFLSMAGIGIEAGYTYYKKSNKGLIGGCFVSIPFKGMLFSFSDEDYPRFQPYLLLYYRYAPALAGEKYSEYGIMLKCPIFLY